MKFYITTPIYYVNDIPHIGHAYTTVAADVISRYKRLCGYQVFFLTGTDEHGQKVDKAAKERGKTPREHADSMIDNFKNLWKKLNISNDAFIRTTDERHIKIVREILQKLFDEEKIKSRSYSGWYCVPDERFWTEKEIMGGNCPDCGRPVEHIEEENYFFEMSKYQQQLIKYIEENPNYILPETRKNEVLGFLEKPLGDLCISRPKERLSWGIPLPFDENYVTYVWLDALVNYYSATKYLAPNGEEWWPADQHLLGKDILTTHSVYWSTMLMALDMPLPKKIYAHGWWTVNGEKMSKSRGNFVDPHEFINKYGVDAVRYFLMREVPFGLDGDFSAIALRRRINSDLANDLGNLLSRTLNIIKKYREGKIPPEIDSKDNEMKSEIKGLLSGPTSARAFDSLMGNLQFHYALSFIWNIIGKMNYYAQNSAPWREKDKDILSNTLYTLAEGLRIIAVYIYPFMPETGQEIWNQLGINEKIDENKFKEVIEWGGLKPDTNIKIGRQLFPRVEEKIEISDKGAMAESAGLSEEKQLISIEEFAKLDLRVGEIKHAERIEKSKKLIKLKVDIGTEERQVVAGIAESYIPEELIGKKIILVSNLKSAKLMGVESKGMILAAGTNERTVIATFEADVKPGAKVK
ncbi:MAG: methionine--tRNA ligase [Nitrospinae bacterium]|nr:methionine--tRNA ligase [Nitrospinota bacterium]